MSLVSKELEVGITFTTHSRKTYLGKSSDMGSERAEKQ